MMQLAYIGPGAITSSGGWPLWVWCLLLVVAPLLVGLAAVGLGELSRRSREHR